MEGVNAQTLLCGKIRNALKISGPVLNEIWKFPVEEIWGGGGKEKKELFLEQSQP